MTRRRRCRICHELFTSDPRVGLRQKACGSPECQTERHRLDCKAWRERERPAEDEERLRRRLGAPDGQFRLGVVRDECGAKIKVVLEECLRLVVQASRDECPAKELEQRRDVFRLVERCPRDETRPPGPAP